MRHKTFLFHPGLLFSKGIKVNKCLQNPGEFIITLAKSYHAGFNMGFNCAEAVNFAYRSWINLGLKAKSCDCQSGSVKVDMNYFFRNLIKNKKLKINETKDLLKNKIISEEELTVMKNKKNKKGVIEELDTDETFDVEKKKYLNKKRKIRQTIEETNIKTAKRKKLKL